MADTGGLQKNLGVLHIFAIASGAMISSGLFILPGLAHAQAGPGVVWSYLLAGLLAAIGIFNIAELTTAMPKAGGDYFFIMRSFGPAVGSVTGLLSWFALLLKSAFAIVGMTTFIKLVSGIHGFAAGYVLGLVFIIVNVLGVHQAARAQVGLVIGMYVLLSVYIISSLWHMQPAFFRPFIPHGWQSVFSATGFVFVSYGGLLKVAGVAEETHNPGRTIPLALGLALIVTTIFYTLTVLVTIGVVPPDKLNSSLMPISHGGSIIMGPAGFAAMSIAAIFAFISTANAGIMSASRYLLALSRDRLLPQRFSQINDRFGTPHTAIVITGAGIMASLFLPLTILVEAASTVLILTFIMSCLSVMLLRQSGVHNYRPQFVAPLYPLLQFAGIVGFGFLLFEMGWHAYVITAGLVLCGVLFFWFYGSRFSAQEYALLHIIERITDKKLVTGLLEMELKSIIRERDKIVLDRFDFLVEGSLVLDIEEHMDAEDFFRSAARELARRLDVGSRELADMLIARERENSTVLNEALAVPHIVIPGEKKFQLLLARARNGVYFSERAPRVSTIFVLIGTPDERHVHLQLLAAIGQVFHAADFEKRWASATNVQGLRDLVLLSGRAREGQKKGRFLTMGGPSPPRPYRAK